MILTPETPPVGPFELQPLRFGYADLEPVIDEATMRLHHGQHHQGYIDKVNAALEAHPQWCGLSITELLSRLPEIPEAIRKAIREQGGGHANHQFFWNTLAPAGTTTVSKDLMEEIEKAFGSLKAFKDQFEAAGMAHFGSGWVHLVCWPEQDLKLSIMTLPNQDSLYESASTARGLMICDLWEHAYYLKHQNRRAEWLSHWWGVVNWTQVSERLSAARAGLMPV
jgi:Fe-Mn family superoxide dismutase